MQFQTINTQSDQHKKARLEKELRDFSIRAHGISMRSYSLLMGLKDLSIKKKADEIRKKIETDQV